MGAEPSLYDVLGVAPGATAEQLRHAYRAAARRTHPDAGGSAPAFAQVNVAYRVLADVGLRRQYDQRLAAAPRPGASGPSTPPGWTVRPTAPGGPGVTRPGADPVVRRRYLVLMGIALTLFISGGAIVRLYSLPAALIMMAVAAVIPPIAVTVASRPRQPPGADGQHPPNGPAG